MIKQLLEGEDLSELLIIIGLFGISTAGMFTEQHQLSGMICTGLLGYLKGVKKNAGNNNNNPEIPERMPEG